MTPTTSPGSNQTGDNVTYSAQRISPSGFGWGAAGWKRPSPSRAHTSAHPSANFFMPSPPALSYRILSRDGKPQRTNHPTTSKLRIGGCRFTQRLRDRPLANEKVEHTAPKPSASSGCVCAGSGTNRPSARNTRQTLRLDASSRRRARKAQSMGLILASVTCRRGSRVDSRSRTARCCDR